MREAVVRDKEAKRAWARQVPCPQCGASAGERCKGPGGYRSTVHRQRTLAAGQSGQGAVIAFRGPSSDDKIAQTIEFGAEAAANAIRETYAWAAERCESPIEKLLVARFLHPHTTWNWDFQRAEILFPKSGSIEHVQPPPLEGVYLWPQIQIGPYRVDFVFAIVQHHKPDPSWALIECDGHDYHERTKHQAQRDKARDRYLTGRGYRVLRFTGSEIYRDPEVVWDEIFKIVLGLCDE